MYKVPDFSYYTHNRFIEQENYEDIWDMLIKLSGITYLQMAEFFAYYILNYKLEDIAKIRKINASTVSRSIDLARKTLDRYFKHYCYGIHWLDFKYFYKKQKHEIKRTTREYLYNMWVSFVENGGPVIE